MQNSHETRLKIKKKMDLGWAKELNKHRLERDHGGLNRLRNTHGAGSLKYHDSYCQVSFNCASVDQRDVSSNIWLLNLLVY